MASIDTAPGVCFYVKTHLFSSRFSGSSELTVVLGFHVHNLYKQRRVVVFLLILFPTVRY